MRRCPLRRKTPLRKCRGAPRLAMNSSGQAESFYCGLSESDKAIRLWKGSPYQPSLGTIDIGDEEEGDGDCERHNQKQMVASLLRAETNEKVAEQGDGCHPAPRQAEGFDSSEPPGCSLAG